MGIMRRMVVTGAGGFIGSNTVQYFQSLDGYEAIGLTHGQLDLLDAVAVSQFFEGIQADIVVHCANQGGNRKSRGTEQDIVERNLRMFYNIERCVTPEMTFVNFGSGAQYDKMRALVQVKESEFDQKVPGDAYGYSKYVMSKYIRQQAGKKRIYNPIVFGMYGPGEDCTYRFISNAIVKSILNLPIIINQDVVFDYLYIKDYLRILQAMIEGDWDLYEFNMTPSESISLKELAQLILEVSGSGQEIIVRNAGMNYEYTADNSKMLEALGQKFEFTSYRLAVEELYCYYKQHIDELDAESVRKDSYIRNCNTIHQGG